MLTAPSKPRRWRQRIRLALRYGWPMLVLLGLLWFPFDWLSTVWPTFGVPFRLVFRNAQDHFIGHTVFFGVVGLLVLAYLRWLRRQPQWYALGLAVAALVQETVQAIFRGRIPTFTDVNAFKGDALGGVLAWLAWFAVTKLRERRRMAAAKP